jgi:hypothetical protein
MTVKSVFLVDTLDTDARGARLAGITVALGI